MTFPDPSAVFGQVLALLPESAAAIDGAFARAGEGLGRGLEIFASLDASMKSLSNQLAAGDMPKALQALSDLSEQLRSLTDALTGESATLQRVAKQNEMASSLLDGLLENMRMMTVLARAARIEVAALNSATENFADFTREILTFTKNARDSIAACARHQGNFSALLRSASKAQGDFEHRYRSQLDSLSGELAAIVGSIHERCGRSAGLAEQAAARSRELGEAVGRAIMALQGGDSARQRLEHVRDATEVADQILATVADGDEALVVDLLSRLQAAQLDDATNDLGGDLTNNAESLDLLSNDTQRLLDFGADIYGGTEDNSSSFLDALETNLSNALSLIHMCEGARAPVDRVTFALGDMLAQLETTVQSLHAIIFDIVLIGINAGLKASRLGPDGRGLVVIAQELNAIAKLISDDAEKLMPVIVLVRNEALGLDRKEIQGVGRIGAIDDTLRSAVVRLRNSNSRLGSAFARLIADGGKVGNILRTVQADISKTAETNDRVRDAAEALRRVCVAQGRTPAPEQMEYVRDTVDDLAGATYTMDVERKIHELIVGCASAKSKDEQKNVA
jgi:hypothetical protein